MLNKPEDRDDWISYIRKYINNQKIWQLVNPELPTRPATIPLPIEPDQPAFERNDIINEARLTQYKTLILFHDRNLIKYKDENKTLRVINTLIVESTSARILAQVAHSDPDSWNNLVALKQRLKPTTPIIMKNTVLATSLITSAAEVLTPPIITSTSELLTPPIITSKTKTSTPSFATSSKAEALTPPLESTKTETLHLQYQLPP